jgi:hypothetical protein
MHRHLLVLATALACVALAGGCTKKDSSPRIVCEVKGAYFSTPYTFDEFRRVLEKEHGTVSWQEGEYLKTDSVEIRFEPRADGTLLATRVIAFGTETPVNPAFFFGLTDEGSLPPPTNAAPLDIPFSNAPPASDAAETGSGT